MDMSCGAVREMLPAYVREGEGSLSVRRHLSRCAGCRTELGHYDQLLTSLVSLETAVAEPNPSLRASLVAIRQGAGRLYGMRAHVSDNRKAYLSGAAVVVAGAAGAAFWKARSRRLVTA